MESYLPRVEELQQKFRQATLGEYQKYDYQLPPPVKEKDSVKNPEKKTEKVNFELDMMYNKINHISKKIHFKKKCEVKEIKGESLQQKLLDDPDIFNIVTNEKEYKEWKQLTIDEKLEKAKEFFASTHNVPDDQPPYNESIQEKIMKLIQENQLYLKKDIEYDKINQRIASIPLIKYKPALQTYILKSTENKKNIKKLSKNAVSKIMKK